MDKGNITFTCKNELGEAERVQRRIAQFCELLGIGGRPLHALNLAVDEVLTNIIRHGYGDGAAHEIRIRMAAHEGVLTAEVEDDGRAFNPVEYPPVDCTKPMSERQPGGLGLHLVRSLINEWNYRREDGKNILTLRKKVS